MLSSQALSLKNLSVICKSHLGIYAVTLEQAHRLGRFQVGKNRPLIAKFTRFKEKQRVLISAKKLKGTKISLSEDYSESVRRKNKFLWDFVQSRKKEGDKYSLKRDVLWFNHTKYIYDEDVNQVVQQK